MSGVIDEYGQWEHCAGCRAFVLIQDLGYVKPSLKHPSGFDICVNCVDTLLRCRLVKFSAVVPAQTWKRAKVTIR